MCRGLRHGYGVRKSAPYGDSQLNNPNKNTSSGPLTNSGMSTSSMLIHSNSLQSANSVDLDDPDSPKPEDGFKPNIDRTLASKNGFVLVAKPLDVPMPASSSSNSSSSTKFNLISDSRSGNRRNSLTNKLASTRIPGSNQTASLLRGLRLRRQKSTSDLDSSMQGGGRNTPDGANNHRGGSSRNQQNSDLPIVPFTLSPEELDITDPTTVETYTGEWKQDKRNGHGVCERSDGLKYEGQWHNDMKCGHGVTTFKDGTKEEGKYKNNILIVDSKVKRFFQLGSANIRQRIDDAVKMANQAQAMALKKADIADTRAATARDKADQATTAALEADRDSQIAFSVARQYSDSQQQLGMGFQQNQLAPNLLLGQTMEPLMPNLGMTSSSLQMRRISQQQVNLYNNMSMHNNQRQSEPLNNMMPDRQPDGYDQSGNSGQQPVHMTSQQQQQHHHHHHHHQQQPQQQQQQQLYIGPVEPFNGRRGSFRGGSHMGGQQQSGFAARNSARPFGQQQQHQQQHQMGGSSTKVTNRQSADPFNDLFDHYKSSGGNASSSSGGRPRLLHKQASLDYNQLRNNLPRHQTSHDQGSAADGTGRSHKLFRMSSLDHAEEHQQKYSRSPADMRATYSSGNNVDSNSMQQQQQLKHLVTSGEDLQNKASPSQRESSSNATTGELDARQNGSGRGLTPTDSSYILPQSTGSSYFGNQTPSPSDGQSSLWSPQQGGGQYYAGNGNHQMQQQPGGYPSRNLGPAANQYSMNGPKQRDVHSLADEQLYMAGRRIHDSQLLDRTEYTNYDFIISSSPRLSRRCMRRTASLSRNTPVKTSGQNLIQPGSQFGQITRRSPSPAISIGVSPSRIGSDFLVPVTVTATPSVAFDAEEQRNPMPNHVGGNTSHDATSNSSHLTLDSSSASSGALLRKPSLQVRYDPHELGGLMSREEVAALSHAQREQRRLELESAEKRAKRPLLHIYLSTIELLSRQRLLVSVIIVNLLLFKLFADLIF